MTYRSRDVDRLHSWLDYHSIEHVSHLRAGILVLKTRRPIAPKSDYMFLQYEKERNPIGRVIWLPRRSPEMMRRHDSDKPWQAPKIVMSNTGFFYELRTFTHFLDAICFFEEANPLIWIKAKEVLPLSDNNGIMVSQEVSMITEGNFAVTIDGELYYHISEVAERTHRSISSLRYLCLKPARGRQQMRHYRDGPRIYIPASEITEYEFFDGQRAYHYVPSTTNPGYYDREYVKESQS